MNRWSPGIKYFDSWVSQFEKGFQIELDLVRIESRVLANMLAQIEEVAARILLVSFSKAYCRP